ncbi:unnamed protein product [Trypanosoma congolense IL3000]|uniref:WGS project CAEQ00000000 data, annotated contig 1682 n=1 Tax=Trypanosoma congolense (strain IL3000) TaxID=1068625 RepID=F9W801_TRYCI|nr:unnamed protein product [Trypanosoma congolense IL3000]
MLKVFKFHNIELCLQTQWLATPLGVCVGLLSFFALQGFLVSRSQNYLASVGSYMALGKTLCFLRYWHLTSAPFSPYVFIDVRSILSTGVLRAISYVSFFIALRELGPLRCAILWSATLLTVKCAAYSLSVLHAMFLVCTTLSIFLCCYEPLRLEKGVTLSLFLTIGGVVFSFLTFIVFDNSLPNSGNFCFLTYEHLFCSVLLAACGFLFAPGEYDLSGMLCCFLSRFMAMACGFVISPYDLELALPAVKHGMHLFIFNLACLSLFIYVSGGSKNGDLFNFFWECCSYYSLRSSCLSNALE